MGRSSSTHDRFGGPARWGAGLVVGVVLVLVWSGCSVEKNYDTLSLFFDGVPDPNAAKAAQAGEATGPANLRASPTYSQHPPFAKEQCSDCHGGRKRLTRNDSAICLKCHENVPTKEERTHGPVAAVACMWCHHPHESAQAKLLREPARKVCSQCHDASVLDTTRVPEHADPGKSCLDCHMGHGGPQPYFLREGHVPGKGL